MPKNVVCKKCNNLVNGWCEKVIDSPDPDMQRDCQHFCEKTNADRIRAMSDEERRKALIDYFSEWAGVGDSYIFDLTRVKEAFALGTMSFDDFREWDEFRIAELVDELIDWLKQPAEGE